MPETMYWTLVLFLSLRSAQRHSSAIRRGIRIIRLIRVIRVIRVIS